MKPLKDDDLKLKLEEAKTPSNCTFLQTKAYVRYFLPNFNFFLPNDSPSKTMKNVFYFI